MTKAILFDFDDTLVTTITTKFEATKNVGRKFYNF
jgi:beta-phosphoglucomutase-like phosphatase (HAD superfamily)